MTNNTDLIEEDKKNIIKILMKIKPTKEEDKKNIIKILMKIKPTKEEVETMSEDNWMRLIYPIKAFKEGYNKALQTSKNEEIEWIKKSLYPQLLFENRCNSNAEFLIKQRLTLLEQDK